MPNTIFFKPFEHRSGENRVDKKGFFNGLLGKQFLSSYFFKQMVSSREIIQIPSLSGWRAICIMLVVFGHSKYTAGFPKDLVKPTEWLFDGRLGVTFFFVISGFLISHLLLREFRATSRIDLPAFYARRALRILPPYWAYLIFIGFLQAAGIHFQSTLQWAANLGFFTNLFETVSLTDHFWSLAIEEQFYLTWPVLLVAFLRKNTRGKAVGILVGVILCSPFIRLLAYLTNPAHPNQTVIHFLGLQTADADSRLQMLSQIAAGLGFFDAISIGCIGALLWNSDKAREKMTQFLNGVAPTILGVAMIATVYVPLHMGRMGWFTIPMLHIFEGIGFIILMFQSILWPGRGFFRILNHPLAVWLGGLSYSWYVWQQVFLASGSTAGLSNQWFLRFPVAIPASLLAAVLSHYCLERPVLGLRSKYRHA